MNTGRDLDDVMDQRLDWALREVEGSACPPDVTARVIARVASGEAGEAGAPADASDAAVLPDRQTRRRPWLVAALLLFGFGAVLGVALIQRGQGSSTEVPATGSGVTQAPGEWIDVHTRADIDALPPDTQFVRGLNLGDDDVEALTRLSDLRGLRLEVRWFRGNDQRPLRWLSDAALPHLGKFQKLRVLHLDWQDRLSGAGLDALTGLPLVAELGLERFDVPDQHLAFLPAMPSLRSLDLTLNHGFTGAGMRHVADCPGLRSLSLHACSQLSAEMLAPIATMTRLETLDLSGIGPCFRGSIGDDHAAESKKREEQRRQWEQDQAGLTDAALAILRPLQNLRRLRLQNCNLHGPGFDAVATLGRLESLDVSWMEPLTIEPAQIPATVTDLDLGKTDIDDERLGSFLQRLPGLRRLVLSKCERVTDRGVTAALALPSLRVLELGSCPISATVLDRIHASPSLDEVVLDLQAWLTSAAVERLFQAGIHVRIDDPSHPLHAQTLTWAKRYPRRAGAEPKR